MGAGRQHIPRPEAWRPGPPPPWADRDLSVLSDPDETLVRLARHLDDSGAAPSAADTDARLRPSAVLVPFVVDDGLPALVLTRRSPHLTHHKGEVSFPGGRLDPGESPVDAALREAHEEIALAPHCVTVLGRLGSLTTYASNSAITPVVARVIGSPEFVPNVAEVERVFVVALRDLAAPGVFSQELWPIAGAPSSIHFYDLADDILWGVTGRMVTNMLDLITRS